LPYDVSVPRNVISALVWAVVVSACAAVGCGAKGSGTDARADGGDAALADGPVADAKPADAGDAGAPDAPAGDGALADAAADTMATLTGPYVSPTIGLDTNTGTRGAPYLTIEKALSVARPGEAVLLLPGSYEPSTQPAFAVTSGTVTVPAGVSVRADEPGTVTLVNGTSAGFTLAGSSSVVGITFRGFAPALRASAGDVQLASLRFDAANVDSCLGIPISITGTAKVTWALGSDDPLGDKVACLLSVGGDAEATLQGGALDGNVASPFSGVAMLTSSGRSKLTVKGMTSTNGNMDAVAAMDESQVVIEGARFEVKADAAVHIVRGSNTARVRIADTVIKGAGLGGCVTAWGYVPASTPRFELTGVTLADCRVGFWAVNYNTPPAPVVTMASVTITAKDQGISMGFGGSLTVTGGAVTGAAGHGIYLYNEAVDASLVMRTTKVMGNMGDGLLLGVRPGNKLDLGTLAEPGGNTIAGNAAGVVNSNLHVRLSAGSLLVTAVGNTWGAGLQGANAQGGYEPAAGQSVLEVAGPQDGPNHKILGAAAAGVTLRLAARP
jgi:hypothetical protein